jgi:DNA-binding transcriptional LysR family regulator
MRSLHLQETSVRYFLEVVKRGSISEAATRLFVSSSAVSRQISALESLLGVPLFERRPRGMTPTAAGELLAMYARRMTLEADRVLADIDGLQGLYKGTVRVTTTSGFALEFLPSVIARFQRRYPGIQFQLHVARAGSVPATVLSGDADIGLTYSRAAERDICVEYQQTAPVMVIMRPGHPLARAPFVRLAQLQPYALALPDSGDGAQPIP